MKRERDRRKISS